MNTQQSSLSDYSLTGYKSFRGMEGNGFNAYLVRNGKKIAGCIDDANGGMLMVNWLDTAAPRVTVDTYDYKGDPQQRTCTPEEARFAKLCDAQPARSIPDGHGGSFTVRHDVEGQINEMVNRIAAEKRLVRMMKNKLVFIRGGRIYSTGFKGAKQMTTEQKSRLVVQAVQNGAEKILNDLSLAEAVALGLECGL